MSNNFQNRRSGPEKEFIKKPEKKNLQEIIGLKNGDVFFGDVKITRKAQPGPVIFSVSDGYGNVDAVIKESSFDAGDIVEIFGKAQERAGKMQIEIFSIKESSFDFEQIMEKSSEPANKKFSIESDRFEKLRPYFYAIAKRIRRAVLENQSILIRHHADSDGINAGLAIEHSCRILMEKIGVNPDHNLYRSPSRAPFYEISDVFRDIVLTKRMIEGHGQKKPLVIVLDNGSTPEDVFGLKTLHALEFETIVVDHHNPIVIQDKKTAVDPYVSLHLNPFIEGLDSQTCAGMLAYELGRWICKEYSNPALPAVAAISDRSNVPETEKYIKNSKKTRKELEEIGIAMDFMAYQLKFDAGRGLFEELYNDPDLVRTINDEVRKGVETQLESTLPYLRTQEIEGVTLSTIDLEKYTMRYKYPAAGKIVSMIHDTVVTGKENKPFITMGYLSDLIVARATLPVLPVPQIIKRIKTDIPHAHIEGGGHDCAGAMKFIPAHLTEILENIKKQIRELNYLANIPD